MSWRSALQQIKSSVPQDAARLEKSWKKNVLETLIFEHRRYCSEKAIEELMTDAERDALRKEFGNNRRQPTAKRFLEGSKSSRNRSQPQHQSSRQCGHSDSTHMNAFLCTGWWRTKMSLLLSVAHGGLTISRPTMTSSLMSCNWRNLISAAATAFCEFPSHVDDDHQKQQQEVKLVLEELKQLLHHVFHIINITCSFDLQTFGSGFVKKLLHHTTLSLLHLKHLC